MAQRRRILEKTRLNPIQVAAANDFVSEPDGRIPDEEILANPKWGLYCLDFESDEAIFVEVPDDRAVYSAAFLYQTQSEMAVNIATMPLSAFQSIAQSIVKPADGFVFIHSVGRCGSTLLSKVFQALPRTLSLSEPDEPTRLGQLMAQGLRPADEIRDLLYSSTMWRAKRCSWPVDRVALKYRSEVMLLAPLFAELFPDERHIFQYRNGLSWMRSVVRGWPPGTRFDEEQTQRMIQAWSRSNPLVHELAQVQSLNEVQIRFISWVNWMEHYSMLPESAVALRYEDLAGHPRSTLKALFDALKIEDVDWDALDEVLSRDSQAGTVYDREERKALRFDIPDDTIESIRELVRSRPKLGDFDVRLPRTISPEGAADRS